MLKKRSLTNHDFHRMNIGRRYFGASLADIQTDEQHYDVLKRYCSKIHRVRRRGIGLLFFGPNSGGKTYGATCILKHAVSAGYSAYCVMAADLTDIVVNNKVFEEDVAEGIISVESRIRNCDFLLLEDVGKEYRAKSGFAENQLENLLRHRTRNLLPTIVTTNLELGEFRDRYAKSTFEIAKECLYPFQVQGIEGGYRGKLAKGLQRDLT